MNNELFTTTYASRFGVYPERSRRATRCTLLYTIRNTQYDIRYTNYFVRIYKRNMQNKPNSLNVQIYINIYDKKDYKNFISLAGQKNKPNSNPIKPILNLNVKIAGQNPNCRYNNIVE